MKHMIRLTNHTATDIMDIFHIADEIRQGKHADILKGKSIVMFFPETSIRTRVTFEKGISLLGGQPILFPPEALDKKEALQDVCGYLSLWADALIVRHKDIRLLEKLAQHSDIPVINAMTDSNHPCEIIADMYALSKRRKDFLKDSYLFCGENGNIGLAWKEASLVMGFDLSQCCPKGWEMEQAFLEGVKAGEELEITFSQKVRLQGGDYLLSLGVTGYKGDSFTVYHRLYDIMNLTVISDRDTVGYFDMESDVKVARL